jgi:3-oxoacyl-[acyl-carrier-protein] synthase II
MLQRRRVVITGLGAVTPLGLDVDSTWQGLLAGRSGVTHITRFDSTDFPSHLAAEVKDFDPRAYMGKADTRRMARFSQLAVAASLQAVEHARLADADVDERRAGVLIGNGIGGLPELVDGVEKLNTHGYARVSPLFFPLVLPNMAAANVSRILGFRGWNSTVTTACAASTQAIGAAAMAISRGSADVMLSGGTEAGITAIGLAGFAQMRALSTRNDDPAGASRPFDKDRDGFVAAEGAAMLVLESLDHARRRGAEVLAEIAGFGSSSDAFHLVRPDPEARGAYAAMRAALLTARMRENEVDYINAHGTSTPLNDKVETAAIRALFGEQAERIPISSTKSMLGHGLGAAGGIEAVVSVKTILDGVIHPTINYRTPDPDCDLDYVPNEARRHTVNTVLSNSFGFGGQNACLVFRRFQDETPPSDAWR